MLRIGPFLAVSATLILLLVRKLRDIKLLKIKEALWGGGGVGSAAERAYLVGEWI